MSLMTGGITYWPKKHFHHPAEASVKTGKIHTAVMLNLIDNVSNKKLKCILNWSFEYEDDLFML